jgi:hypothetical protein
MARSGCFRDQETALRRFVGFYDQCVLDGRLCGAHLRLTTEPWTGLGGGGSSHWRGSGAGVGAQIASVVAFAKGDISVTPEQDQFRDYCIDRSVCIHVHVLSRRNKPLPQQWRERHRAPSTAHCGW